MKIAISVESTADYTKEIIESKDIKVVPFTIKLDEKVALDGQITSEEIINYVNKTGILPKTSAVNEYQYDEHFKNILTEYDGIVHFSLSSKMSSAYNNAVRSSKKFKNVYVIDTLSLSTGIGLLALHGKDLADAGCDAETIYNKCLKRVPYIQASFELKRLDYLYKGGRCSALTLFGANLLKIRPQIIVKDGVMIPGKKYRGNYEHVVKSYCEDVIEKFNNPDLTRAFVTYSTADDSIIESAKAYLIDRGFKEVLVTRAGGTITSHCGEDCLGILYINDGLNEIN